MQILILEDGACIVGELARTLRRQGDMVELAHLRETAMHRSAAERYDLVILDLSLCGADGVEILRSLEHYRDLVPLLVLTARGQVDERVQAFEMGADCLAEPFALRELAARVRALLRRSRPLEEAHRLACGPLVVDNDAHRAYLAGEPLTLLPREWAVLQILLAHAERVVSKETISRLVATCGKPMSANTIETYISRLRVKVECARLRIQTVHRVGYMLEAVAPVAARARAEALSP